MKSRLKAQIKLPSFTLQLLVRAGKSPSLQTKREAVCCRIGPNDGFVFAQAIVARNRQIRRRKGSFLSSHIAKFIRQWNKPTRPSIRKCRLDTNISGESAAAHNDQFKHWVRLFVGCWGVRVRPLCALRPTWRPKWTQRSNLAEQTAFARRQTPTHSPPLRLPADKDTRFAFCYSCALAASLALSRCISTQLTNSPRSRSERALRRSLTCF